MEKMPKSTKKIDEKGCEERHSKLKSISMKSLNVPHKKSRNTSFCTENHQKFKGPYISINKKLADSSSSESVIYVGSYSLQEKFPIIDLTNSMTSIAENETATLIQKYPKLNKSHTVYSSIKSQSENLSFGCTASSSRLLDSLEGPKSYLKRNSKSASCLLEISDNQNVNMFKNIDVPEESHLLTNKEISYVNQITQLRKEDHDIINSSLEISEDVNILDECNPQVILNSDDSVETLMKIYQVQGNDNFV